MDGVNLGGRRIDICPFGGMDVLVATSIETGVVEPGVETTEVLAIRVITVILLACDMVNEFFALIETIYFVEGCKDEKFPDNVFVS